MEAIGSTSTTEAFRIAIADGHLAFRRNLKSFLVRRGDLDVVGEASEGRELCDLFERLALRNLVPHLIIIDMSMLLHMEAHIPKVKMNFCGMNLLVLTNYDNPEYVNRARSIGAKGCLLKKDTAAEVFAAIEMIKLGGIYFPPHLDGGCSNRP